MKVPCYVCGRLTGAVIGKICDRCQELREHVQLNPKIIKKLMEEIGYKVKLRPE